MSLVDSTTDLAGGGHGTAAGAPPANTDPITPEMVARQCRAIEVWAERCNSISELGDADRRLGVIGEYVQRTGTEGRSRVELTRLRVGRRMKRLSERPASQRVGSAPMPSPTELSRAAWRVSREVLTLDPVEVAAMSEPATRERFLELATDFREFGERLEAALRKVAA